MNSKRSIIICSCKGLNYYDINRLSYMQNNSFLPYKTSYPFQDGY